MSPTPTGMASIANQGRFDSLFKDIEDAAFALDRRTRTVLACNPAVTPMFGYPVDEMIGKTLRAVHATAAEFDRFDRAVLTADASGAYVGKFRMRRRQGTVFSAAHRIIPIRKRTGAEFLINIVRDESEIRDREAERDATVSALRQRIDEAPDQRHALASTLKTIRRMHGWDYGEARVPVNGNALEMVAASFDRTGILHRFYDVSRIVTYKRGEGMVGRVWKSGNDVWLPDLKFVSPRVFLRVVSALMLGLRSSYCVAVRSQEKVVSILMFASHIARTSDEKLVDEAVEILGAVAGPLARKPLIKLAGNDRRMIDAAARPHQSTPVGPGHVPTYPVLALTAGSEANPAVDASTVIWSQFERLTPREGEVLAHIMLGESNKSIARALGISHRTVETHRLSIWRKLQVHSLNELLIKYMSSIG